MIRPVIFSFLAFIISGCATFSKVPGNDSYCFETQYGNDHTNHFQEAIYDYGRFRNYPANANRLICSFRKFYPLHIHWITTSGEEGNKLIDVPGLMEGIRTVRQASETGKPKLLFTLTSQEIELNYIVTTRIDKGPAPDGGRYVGRKYITYPVFHQLLGEK